MFYRFFRYCLCDIISLSSNGSLLPFPWLYLLCYLIFKSQNYCPYTFWFKFSKQSRRLTHFPLKLMEAICLNPLNCFENVKICLSCPVLSSNIHLHWSDFSAMQNLKPFMSVINIQEFSFIYQPACSIQKTYDLIALALLNLLGTKSYLLAVFAMWIDYQSFITHCRFCPWNKLFFCILGIL